MTHLLALPQGQKVEFALPRAPRSARPRRGRGSRSRLALHRHIPSKRQPRPLRWSHGYRTSRMRWGGCWH
ncbi:hypothetical protein AAC387_Pa10g0522 [Persea americana]